MYRFLFPIAILFTLSSCARIHGVRESKAEQFTQELCECMSEEFPKFSEATWEVLDYLVEREVTDDESDVQTKIAEVKARLNPSELPVFVGEMDYIMTEFDYEEYTETCGEPLLEKYPEFDKLTTEELVDILATYATEDCKEMQWSITIYQKYD